MPYTKKIKNLEGGKKEKEKPWRDLKDRNQHQGAGSVGQTEVPPVPLGAQSPGVSGAGRGKHGIRQIDPARAGPEMRDSGRYRHRTQRDQRLSLNPRLGPQSEPRSNQKRSLTGGRMLSEARKVPQPSASRRKHRLTPACSPWRSPLRSWSVTHVRSGLHR